jgi:DNA-binding response OmpR family regulator
VIWYDKRVKRSTVLVVDDEVDVRQLVRVLLERAGFDISEAGSGREALRRLHQVRPDLVVLDVTMPDLDGWQTLERIRDLSDVPVLMLTARAAELDKVRGLKAGADDYVTKPFGRQELLARVEALLRRASGPPEVREAYSDGALHIDFASREVVAGDRDVSLTPLEFRLLGAFVRHPNQVLSREQLLELVWGDPETVAPDQVKLYVGYLRRKLGWDAAERSPLETVRGFGYRYRPPASREGARESTSSTESRSPPS